MRSCVQRLVCSDIEVIHCFHFKGKKNHSIYLYGANDVTSCRAFKTLLRGLVRYLACRSFKSQNHALQRPALGWLKMFAALHFNAHAQALVVALQNGEAL